MGNEKRDAEVYFGTAGWSYDDWAGTVYPAPLPAGFNPLAFLATDFEFVEVNTSFYRTPSLKLTSGWVKKTSNLERFGFWIKIHQQFTHQFSLDNSDAAAFTASLQPLAEAGKLWGLLAQFPYSFMFGPESMAYLKKLVELFHSFHSPSLAVEFRHRSWDRDEVFDFFRQAGVTWTNIDQPVISASLPLSARVTNAANAYLRLHGRNYRNWFANQGRDARYDYSYTATELGQIVAVIKKLRDQVRQVFVSGNNHYRGQAVKNLKQLKKMLAE